VILIGGNICELALCKYLPIVKKRKTEHFLAKLAGKCQVRGHNVADLDPLGIFAADLDTSEVPELLPHTYALGKAQPWRWVSWWAVCVPRPLHAYAQHVE